MSGRRARRETVAAALLSALVSRPVPGVPANGGRTDGDGDAAIGAVAQAVAIRAVATIDTGAGRERRCGIVEFAAMPRARIGRRAT